MHRDIPVTDVEIDEYSNIVSLGVLYNKEHLPTGTLNKAGIDRKRLNRWWTKRSIPISRTGVKEVLDSLDLTLPQQLVQKCYGLSLSDQYWVSPADKPLDWKQINFFDNAFSEDVGNALFGYGILNDSLSLISPDNTSDGQLKKKWKIADGKRVLVKAGSNPYKQEPLNEVISSLLADCLGIPHTAYTLSWENGEAQSACEDFITRDTELVPAAQVISAYKKPQSVSEYEFYLQCLQTLGIKDARERTEQMLVLDFLIANEDRHYNNFGLLRNAVTLEWLGVAPIYDCGTSLWFNTQSSAIDPLSDNLKCKPFRKTQNEQIKLVRDLSRFDFGKLNGIEDECAKIFATSPFISEERRTKICSAIRQRIDYLSGIAMSQTNEIEDDEAQNETGSSGITMI